MHTSVTVLLSTLALSAVWVCQAVQPQPHLRSFDAGRFARLTPAKEMARWPGEHLPTKLFMYVRHLVKDKISPSEDSVFTTLERAMGDLELAMNNFACFRDIPRSDVRKCFAAGEYRSSEFLDDTHIISNKFTQWRSKVWERLEELSQAQCLSKDEFQEALAGQRVYDANTEQLLGEADFMDSRGDEDREELITACDFVREAATWTLNMLEKHIPIRALPREKRTRDEEPSGVTFRMLAGTPSSNALLFFKPKDIEFYSPVRGVAFDLPSGKWVASDRNIRLTWSHLPGAARRALMLMNEKKEWHLTRMMWDELDVVTRLTFSDIFAPLWDSDRSVADPELWTEPEFLQRQDIFLSMNGKLLKGTSHASAQPVWLIEFRTSDVHRAGAIVDAVTKFGLLTTECPSSLHPKVQVEGSTQKASSTEAEQEATQALVRKVRGE